MDAAAPALRLASPSSSLRRAPTIAILLLLPPRRPPSTQAGWDTVCHLLPGAALLSVFLCILFLRVRQQRRASTATPSTRRGNARHGLLLPSCLGELGLWPSPSRRGRPRQPWEAACQGAARSVDVRLVGAVQCDSFISLPYVTALWVLIVHAPSVSALWSSPVCFV